MYKCIAATAVAVVLVVPSFAARAQITTPAAQSTGGEPGTPPLTPEQKDIQDEIARQMAAREKGLWKFGLRPNGGGFYLTSPDENIQFRLLGYAQALATVVNKDFTNSFGSTDMRIRRARVGWLMTLQKKYELFIEYDGVPETGNLVEARLNWQLHGDDVQLRAGKFVVPFSEEGWRSSRNYDTVERFVALNSLYALPAMDTQMGLMLHGSVLKDNKLTYYAGVWNGNAAASNNLRDNNDDKEYQAKVSYKVTPELRVGVGLDYTREEGQTLRLNSLTGTRFAGVEVKGVREGADGDFFFERKRLSLRGEAMSLDFADSDTTLAGGFLQAAWFLSGDYNGGFQPLMRIEKTQVSDDRVKGEASRSSIAIITAGFNWYLSNNVRLQVNAIGEDFNRRANLAVREDGLKPSLLTELQFRF